MPLVGGAILPEVFEWLHSFIPELKGLPANLIAPDNVSLSAASEDLRQQKYSYEKLHDMFLLYSKCADGTSDTVVKALAENYFMRAFRNYKYPVLAYKTFNDLAQARMDHNLEVIGSFGEGTTRLCAIGLSEEVKEMSLTMRANDEEVAKLREELDIEKRFIASKLREQDEHIRSELGQEYQRQIEARELAIAEKYTSLQVENQDLKRVLDKTRKSKKHLEQRLEVFDETMSENSALKQQVSEDLRDKKILREEIQKRSDDLDKMDKDAREEINRIRDEVKAIARSATESVLLLEKELAVCKERLQGEKVRYGDLEETLKKTQMDCKTLKTLIPVIRHDNAGCSIT